MDNSDLFYAPFPNPNAKLRVICFPFAGGSATTFSPWIKLLHNDAELLTVQLAGRGSRLLDTPCDNMAEMVAGLLLEIQPFIQKPYLFFGHSMGSRIAFELACALHKNNLPLPVHFVASASAAPFIPRTTESIHELSEEKFIARLSKLNGTPERILKNKELMELILPALRADFKLVETYLGSKEIVLPTKVSVYGGIDDNAICFNDQIAWREVFKEIEEIHQFPGGHFFLNEHPELLINRINKLITNLLAGVGSVPKPVEDFA